MAEASKLKDRVLLLMHTPFGINENYLYNFYILKYEQALLSIINQYSSIILVCLSGHRHEDSFRVYSSSEATLGILSHPSISPIGYLSLPSIRRYRYNRVSIQLTDYDQYTLNLLESERTGRESWSLSYTFTSWYYQSREITSNSLRQLTYRVRTESSYLKRFLLAKYYSVNTTLTRHKIIQVVCAMTLFNFDEFILCTRLLEKKHLELYSEMIMNYLTQLNPHSAEQSNEYRHVYRRIAVFLFVVSITIGALIYRIFTIYLL